MVNKTLVATLTTVCVQSTIMLGFVAINNGPRAIIGYGFALATIIGLIKKWFGVTRLVSWVIENSATKEQQQRLLGGVVKTDDINKKTK